MTRRSTVVGKPGSKYHSLPLRLPAELYEQVKKAAEADRRNITNWITVTLEDALKNRDQA